MIVCHTHKFIFIKTEKTAGTSIEIALSQFCGPHDIITPISPEDEKLRRARGFRGPQHHLAPLTAYDWRDVRALLKGRAKLRIYNHAPAARVRELVGDHIWSSYFKFCVERNPWDRAISAYYWKTANKSPRPSLREFINSSMINSLQERGIGAYTIDGEVVVDKICRYEHLSEDLEAVRARLGLPTPLALPNAKSQTRTDRRSYRDVFDAADRDHIAALFAREIALMNYAF